MPSTLGAGISYRIAVIVNGAEVIPSSWSVTTGSGTVAHGFGSFINFVPISPVPHTISARAVGEFGLFQDVAVTVNVGTLGGQAEAGVNWEKLLFTSGENLRAKIVARDNRGQPPSRIQWSVYFNGTPVFRGEGAAINYTGTQPGTYRVKGTAYCFDGTQLQFDSAAFVQGTALVRHNLPVPEEGGTMVYLGAVYTQNIAAAAGVATALPYKTASSTEDIAFLPGTTHWTFDLDPDTTAVDDEVVVRTIKGNWCLNGLAGGLAGENIGYDYGYMPTFIPAPINYRVRLTVDTWKVHGLSFNGFNTRVRIKCYRLIQNIYRYTRCANSQFPGGEGRRNRRFAMMFTKLDVQTDVFTNLNRMGTGTSVITYETTNTTSVPRMALSTLGSPDPVQGYTGLFYTDSNLYAFYEADGKPDIAAHAISGIELVRPCCVSLLTFRKSKPVISNRIKRVHGKLVLFLQDGVVFEGSFVNIRARTLTNASPDYMVVSNGGPVNGTYPKLGELFGKPIYGMILGSIWWNGVQWQIQGTSGVLYVSSEDTPTPDLVVDWQPVVGGIPLNPNVSTYDWAVPVNQTYYANDGDTLLKIGEIDVDLSDPQFDETGLVLEFVLDETGAVTGPLPDPLPTPVVGSTYIYSVRYAPTVNFDGACYVNPEFVPVLDDNAVLVTAIGGCQDPVCGPATHYCYTALDAPAENVVVPQPMGFPAPYIAFGSNPARCYHSPVATVTVDGTLITLAAYTGSDAVDLVGYSGTERCGYSYGYTACQANYAPCTAYACSIVVVYPVSSSPHTVVEYGGHCYYFNGSTTEYGTRLAVSAAAVNPVIDCYDPACNQFNASGSVVVYNDKQTFLEVPVLFDHLDYGTAHYGVAAAVLDDWSGGLKAGQKSCMFHRDPVVLMYTSEGTGSMMFEFGLSGVRKQILVDRAGVHTLYSPGMGGTRATVTLQPGDKVYMCVFDAYRRLPLQYRNLRFTVRWHPLLYLPRLYDTVVMPFTGSSAINAVGFCAYTDQGDYTFYGTLPFNGTMTGPVNPDSIVTVTSDAQEYLLVAARNTGDVTMFQLGGVPWYSGQVINGPFTFKFYAGREAFGAHGEMDVWLDAEGTFPGYLRAGAFDVVQLSGTAYRKDASPTDTHRNSYSVVTQEVAAAITWPCVYVGSRLVSAYNALAVYFNGSYYQPLNYVSTSSPFEQQPMFDPGISSVLQGVPVAPVLAQTSPTDLNWTFAYPLPVTWVVEETVSGAGLWALADTTAGNTLHFEHGALGYDYRVIGVDADGLPVTVYSNVVVYT